MNTLAIATLATVAAMLTASRHGYSDTAAACKMLASCGFLLTAWRAGAFQSAYGILIFIGLVFSWFGDLFLIRGDKPYFLAGLVVFLIAHLAYTAAFAVRGIVWGYAAAALLVLVPMVIAILTWLMPYVDANMRMPVIAYIIVITSMVAAASGLLQRPWGVVIIAGAFLFYLSDIAVARSRFVQPGYINGLIGLPLYYTGQVLLALSAYGAKP